MQALPIARNGTTALLRLLMNNSRRRKKYESGYTVLSLTVPGIQGIHDQKKAEAEATKTDDWVANEIKDHRDKLDAFACLSLHNAKQAGK